MGCSILIVSLHWDNFDFCLFSLISLYVTANRTEENEGHYHYQQLQRSFCAILSFSFDHINTTRPLSLELVLKSISKLITRNLAVGCGEATVDRPSVESTLVTVKQIHGV